MTNKHFANGEGKVTRQASLCHVPASTRRERRRNVLRLFVNGQEDNPCPPLHIAKRRSYLNSIHNRHRYVEHDNIRIEAHDLADRFLSVVGYSGDFKFATQFIPKVCEHFSIIIDEQNTNCGHNSSSKARGASRGPCS